MAGYANDKVLVDTRWVADHAGDANVKLVEVDVDTNAYEEGHIEGAVGWNWTSQLQDPVRRDIITREDLQDLLRRSGIEKDDTIVLYGDNNNWFAAYAYWILKLYRHADARLMNGGRKKWEAENRPLVEAEPNPAPSQYVVPEPDPSVRSKRDEVLANLKNNDGALVDVRSPAEFNGEILAPPGLQETAQRPGHIPGAANVPWGKVVNEDGTFKSADELSELYEGQGVTQNKDVITYCRIGERSSHTWFVLRELLGYPNVRNYDGSWTEWGSMIDVPIER